MTDVDLEILIDLIPPGKEFDEALMVCSPPDEPPVPDIEHPPGNWTEYSDTPLTYRLLRLSRTQYTAEEAGVRAQELAKTWGTRLHGEVFYDVRYWCWRAVPLGGDK